MNMPTHKFTFKGLLSGFVIALLAIPGTTLAQELEGNDTSAQAQALSVVSGSASLAGMIGDNAGMPTGDVDIFAIDASQASMLDIRVTSTDACSNVDPAVALFDDAGNNLRMSADVFFDMAPGQSICDAWIKPTAALPADGRYYVVVTGTPMFMSSGWVLSATTATGGGYSLDVSGVIPLAAETGGNTDTENLTET
ncbi:MAG: hypothetical protein GTO41_05600, partial [Burkholderiales bacterium]|nr:hypothetical protein [Burkholderiales bacterium]